MPYAIVFIWILMDTNHSKSMQYKSARSKFTNKSCPPYFYIEDTIFRFSDNNDNKWQFMSWLNRDMSEILTGDTNAENDNP